TGLIVKLGTEFIFAGCGETLTEPTGSFTSPGHPTDYPHGANCTWYISVEPGNLIRLSFTTFNLEYHTNCGYDYVDVYDNGTALTGTLMGMHFLLCTCVLNQMNISQTVDMKSGVELPTCLTVI
uniref:CUB domain-containing protein n=1 Tax=Sinocyclocheilus grahami TaxID=75366 RepID=A0A672M2B6_SINGR